MTKPRPNTWNTCVAKTQRGRRCRALANLSGFCPTHEAEGGVTRVVEKCGCVRRTGEAPPGREIRGPYKGGEYGRLCVVCWRHVGAVTAAKALSAKIGAHRD